MILIIVRKSRCKCKVSHGIGIGSVKVLCQIKPRMWQMKVYLLSGLAIKPIACRAVPARQEEKRQSQF